MCSCSRSFPEPGKARQASPSRGGNLFPVPSPLPKNVRRLHGKVLPCHLTAVRSAFSKAVATIPLTPFAPPPCALDTLPTRRWGLLPPGRSVTSEAGSEKVMHFSLVCWDTCLEP